MTDAPLLSVVITGRNDEYGGGFTQRFLQTLAFNHAQLRAHGIAHEFVLVEWNPDSERPWLADVVARALPELDASILTAYLVDPRYHDALRLNPRLEYLEFIAKNVGVRRARGRFVLTTNCDVYLGRHVLARLQADDLRDDVLYRAPRLDLKINADHSTVDWDVLEDPRNLVGEPKTLMPPLFKGGTGDFILLDRDAWHRLRGFNEVYRLARIGLDHNFLVKAYSNGHPIEHIGGPVYHVNHVGSFRITRGQYEGREGTAPWGDSRWPAGRVTYANADTWGLRDAPARLLVPGCVWLGFDWAAVPPLVDLRRIVLPPARVGLPAL